MKRCAILCLAALAHFFAATGPVFAAASDDLTALTMARDEDMLRIYPSAAISRGDRRYLDRYEEDLKAAHLANGRDLNEAYRARIAAIPRDGLSESEQISYDILSWELERERIAFDEGFAGIEQMLPLDHIYGRHLAFARDMQWASAYPFNTVEDYERAIARMGGFARWIDRAIANMREGAARGITLPRLVTAHLVEQLRPLAERSAVDSGFLGPVTNMPSEIPESERARVGENYARAVSEVVLPAYRRLGDFLAGDYSAASRESIGLWALPGGRAFYLYKIKEETTLSLSPEEIHAIGLGEIARIEREKARLVASLGFTGTVDEFQTALRNDPRFRFASADAMKAEFERVRSVVEDRLPDLFGRLPRTDLEFRFVEDFAAPFGAAAYYTMPSFDGARPGIVYLNTYDLPSRPGYATDALELHEGVPGHHLALSLQIENNTLPGFRRFRDETAFHEGWALYAETLGDDLGLYTDPYRAFGRLSFDAWRASRLVIDTGIHWYGWSRDDALTYLRAHTALTETDAVAEVERYIALPAQALSYKLGQRVFLDIRARAENALQERFDIGRFHDALLMEGAMPLPLLDARMTRWIAREQAP